MGNILPTKCKRPPRQDYVKFPEPHGQIVMTLKTKKDKNGNRFFTIPERTYTVLPNGKFVDMQSGLDLNPKKKLKSYNIV